MLSFNRLMGLLALAALLTGTVTRESGFIWYADLFLVVVSVMSEGVALFNWMKGRTKNAA
ncbi:hypothetical protein [Pantoea sp.]|uniref:hypothetical protein n=1 Tax=Pantoea sp. TaxID=69393 RepID=UPI0031DEEA35